MSMFEVYSKKTVIDGHEYKVLPLSGEFLPTLFELLKKLFPDGETAGDLSDEDFMKKLSGDVVKDVHLLCKVTLKQTYPEVPDKDLDLFVTTNMWRLFPVMLEVNMGVQKEDAGQA